MNNGNTYNQQNFNQNQYSQSQNIGPAPFGASGYKSATVAGILGIVLGTIGVHDFYLGDKRKGIIHVTLAGIGIVGEAILPAILTEALSYSALYRIGWLIAMLNIAGGLCVAVSSIWGFIDGIRILIAGDAGLAARGIPVAPQAQFGGQNSFNNMQAPQAPQYPQQPVQPQPTQPQPEQPTQDNQEMTNERGGEGA